MHWLNPFSLTLLLSGIIFVAAAEWMSRRPPAKINDLLGYRTPASMASQERWDFAQQASAVRSRFWGWVMIALALFGYAFGNLPEWLGVVLSMVVLIGCCVMLLLGTEKDILKHFGPVKR